MKDNTQPVKEVTETTGYKWTNELVLEFAKQYRYSSSRISIEMFMAGIHFPITPTPVKESEVDSDWNYEYDFLFKLTDKVNEMDNGDGVSMEEVECVLLAINYSEDTPKESGNEAAAHQSSSPVSEDELDKMAKKYSEKVIPVVDIKNDRIMTTRELVREVVYDAFKVGYAARPASNDDKELTKTCMTLTNAFDESSSPSNDVQQEGEGKEVIEAIKFIGECDYYRSPQVDEWYEPSGESIGSSKDVYKKFKTRCEK
jgi:hypothetical protein